MTLVWDRAVRYSGGELLCLLALADWAGEDGICWPSVPRIAEKCRLSDRQVQRVLAGLEQDGAISIERGGGRGRPTHYRVNPDNLAVSPGKAAKGDKVSPFPAPEAPVKGDMVSPFANGERVTFATVKGDICDTSNRKIRQDPPQKQIPTPTPPCKQGGERAAHAGRSRAGRRGAEGAYRKQPAGRRAAVERVMAACGCADPRIAPAVAEAMELAERTEGLGSAAIAERMIAAWTEYCELGEFMRYAIGLRKFFAQGTWQRPALWPIDWGRMERAQRGAVGKRKGDAPESGEFFDREFCQDVLARAQQGKPYDSELLRNCRLRLAELDAAQGVIA